MEMSGEYRIEAPRETVWSALNDPDILKQCIPGCESIEKTGDNRFDATVQAKVGPVKAKFGGTVTLENLNPPDSYTISGEGKGGAAGFARGSADVALEDDGDATLLKYTASAQVGGKLAQIGSRLVQGTAKKYADDFFGRFHAIVADGAAAGTGEAAEPEAAPRPEPEPAPRSEPPEPPPSPAIKPTPPQPPTPPSPSRPAATTGTSVPPQAHASDGEAATRTPTTATTEAPAPARGEAQQPPPPEAQGGLGQRGLSPLFWVSGIVAIVVILLLIF